MARRRPPATKGARTRIERRVPTECGTDLRGADCRIVDVYESEAKGGQEHAIVELDATGAVIGVPTNALRGTRRRPLGSPGLFRRGWERIFGGR